MEKMLETYVSELEKEVTLAFEEMNGPGDREQTVAKLEYRVYWHAVAQELRGLIETVLEKGDNFNADEFVQVLDRLEKWYYDEAQSKNIRLKKVKELWESEHKLSWFEEMIVLRLEYCIFHGRATGVSIARNAYQSGDYLGE